MVVSVYRTPAYKVNLRGGITDYGSLGPAEARKRCQRMPGSRRGNPYRVAALSSANVI